MWRQTWVTERLGMRLPIVAAPMAGGPTTPRLTAAVSEAGGLGILGGGYSTPDQLRAAIRETRALTSAPFGVNLFVPEDVTVSRDDVEAGVRALAPYAEELGVALAVPERYAENFDDQLAVLIEERIALFSFTFGVPSGDVLAAVRDAGIPSCGTATTVAEAEALVSAGVDLVCVQGGEAGGHRGGFLGDPAQNSVGLIALVPLVCDAVAVPVIAAGGVMDGRGVAACLLLGAAAVQLGTAFLRCPEAGTNSPYREAVAAATEADTVLTRAFSGRPARGLRNRMAAELAETPLPPYPVTNAITRELRRRAAELGQVDYLSLWAGQGAPLGRELPAAELVRALEAETDAALRRLGPD